MTWNPLLAETLAVPGTTKLFDSSQIPGEIIDMLVVSSEVLAANPAFGKALAGAWYETMALMSASDESRLPTVTSAARSHSPTSRKGCL